MCANLYTKKNSDGKNIFVAYLFTNFGYFECQNIFEYLVVYNLYRKMTKNIPTLLSKVKTILIRNYLLSKYLI